MDHLIDWKVCCIKGCESATLSLGLCNKHWRRNKLYGSPVAMQKHTGMFVGKSAEERFKLQYRVASSGCWEWTGGKDADGYGTFRGLVNGVLYQRAHRWSWANFNKAAIPEGGAICHRCDNPSCVNPEHLWLGNNELNQRDKRVKGRAKTANGAESHWSKLTEEQVVQILKDPRPASKIASELNVSAGTISDIKRRRSWAHIQVDHVVKAKRISPRLGVSDRITPEIVRHIRASTASGKELAAEFKISPQQICAIRKRRAWAHVE